ncbi:hypothetical protein BD310DRAFT_977262 [Dichomitus squalens]|uniref:F-box domain-containing protein n=1 Tax=Dichomitus squalens TaxID=114155 RepID=A0A4Q9PVG5_9APHY|nr:hypothetical protein BD310DRAFT_977262 [Dichomitus squalens]
MATLFEHGDIPCTHQKWYIDEILRNILDHISFECDGTLASCARTSRALSELALDALWRKISGLVPLCSLSLPSFSEEGKEGDAGPTFLQFSHVAQYLPFLSLTLRRVTFYVQAASPSPWTGTLTQERHDLLGILDVCSPCVEELSLEGVDFQASARLAAPVIFNHLRVLHLGSVFTSMSNILIHCSKMPRLASLSIILRRSADSDDVRLQRGDERHGMPTLSVLEVLRAAGAPLEILHAVDSPMLHTVSLSVSVPDHDTDGWTRCASVLSARFSTSLRTLHAECVQSGIVVPDRALPFAQYIKPLLTVRQLRECAIIIEDLAGVALTNEHLDTMACSWSFLTILEVAFRGGRTAVPRPTITSLLAFAYRCPGITKS